MERILIEGFECQAREELCDEILLVVGRGLDAVLACNKVLESIQCKSEIDRVKI
jgi:nitrogenase subunit NifH